MAKKIGQIFLHKKSWLTVGTVLLCLIAILALQGYPFDLNPKIALAKPKSKPPATSAQCKQDILNTFGIDMQGFDEKHLQWAWEKFSEIQHTNFFNLSVRSTTNVARNNQIINVTAAGSSRQVNCNAIELKKYTDEEYFNIALIHEIGHIIYNCNEMAVNLRAEFSQALNAEGAVTDYAATGGCGGSNIVSEDYAETIAYYLNPLAKAQLSFCTKAKAVNPFANGAHPLHFNVAKRLLGEYP